MKKTLSLRKQAELAPKFVLFIDGPGYLAEKQGLTGVNFTPELELAMKYSIGFDDAEQKLSIWNVAAKRLFNSDVKFEAIAI